MKYLGIFKMGLITKWFLLGICLSMRLFAGFSHPIDIVYTWVDGSDPEWQKIKNTYLLQDKGIIDVFNSYSENRWTNHDELKFSLRSVAQFVPFVNHIYIVTMNQVPKWLNPHPKITIIDHKEIFNDLNHLPTFNSQAIESHLHRIPNLSEHYLYLNDDFFFGAPVKPDDFFSEDGHLKVLFDSKLTPFEDFMKVASKDTAHRKAWKNTNAFLNQYFKNERRYFLSHSPYPFIKSYIEAIEQEFLKIFKVTSRNRFRSSEDYNITCGFLHYVWKYRGYVESSTIRNHTAKLSSSRLSSFRSLKLILVQKPQTFCVQDFINSDRGQVDSLLHNFFLKLFPNPAPWEKKS